MVIIISVGDFTKIVCLKRPSIPGQVFAVEPSPLLGTILKPPKFCIC